MKKPVLALLLLTSVAFAKSVYAPLPPDAYTAKTIAIVNHTNTQKVADRAYEEIQKWGRFTVVSDAASADIVLVIDLEHHITGATGHTTLNSYGNTAHANTSVSDNRVMTVTTSFILKGHQDPFFTETETAALFRKSATKRGVDELKKRLDQKP